MPSWLSVLSMTRSLITTNSVRAERLSFSLHLFSLIIYFPMQLLFLPCDVIIVTILALIRKTPVNPIFICGSPRSGSTLLHRLLLSTSDDLYGITHLEWRFPSISLQLLLRLTGIKTYLSTLNYWENSPARDVIAKMHPNSLGDYEEDGILFEERIGFHPYQFLHFPHDSLNISNSFSVIAGTSHFLSLSKRMQRFYHFIVLSMGLLKGRSRFFVSKEVASNDKLHYLSKQFPRARFIVITRKPSSYISSLRPLLGLSTYSKTGSESHYSDPSWWSSWYFWLRQQSEHLSHFYLHTSLCQPAKVLHLRYEDLISDPLKELMRIHTFLGIDLTPQFEATIEKFVESQSCRVRGYTYPQLSISDFDFELFNKTFYSDLA